MRDFEARYCYDHFWDEQRAGVPGTRYLSNGHAFVVVGDAGRPFFVDRDRGVLAQFRHQHFLLFLIAHFHKAALLMLSDRLVDALQPARHRAMPSRVKRFKRTIRAAARDLPALHAPLLVPRGLGPAAGAGAVPHDLELPRRSIALYDEVTRATSRT